MSEPNYDQLDEGLLETILIGKVNKLLGIYGKYLKDGNMPIRSYHKITLLDAQITRIKDEIKERHAPTDEWEDGERRVKYLAGQYPYPHHREM